jgi:ubiquinone/menaquinone biosynthesis C-methylase UbiE
VGHGGHKFDPSHRAGLDSPERKAYLDADRILRAFDVKPGERLADIGAGTGFFAIPAAKMVGEKGHVYAIDLEPAMLSDLREKVASARLKNVEALRSVEEHVPVPNHDVDMVLLACVLHELDGPGTLHESRRILRPRGRLAVVDWKKIRQPEGPPFEHRLDERQASSRIEAAGFRTARTFVAGPYHYGLEARPDRS